MHIVMLRAVGVLHGRNVLFRRGKGCTVKSNQRKAGTQKGKRKKLLHDNNLNNVTMIEKNNKIRPTTD